MLRLVIIGSIVLAGCDGSAGIEGDEIDGAARDASRADGSSSRDGASNDAGGDADSEDRLDATAPDAGDPDASAPDAGDPDASAADSGEPDASEPDASVPDATVSETTPSGWFVWWRRVDESGAVVEEITDADMTWMVGSSGWPGCPDGISCTRTGIEVLGFDPASARYHHMHRVTTGSDFQDNGTFTFADGMVTVTFDQSYSCAHPSGGPYDRDGTESHAARVDDEGFLHWDDWIYRPISREDAHGKYDHPYCGAARKGVAECHCLCPSLDVLADYACDL